MKVRKLSNPPKEEELQGLPIEHLDHMAFGVYEGEVVMLKTDRLSLPFGDLENATYQSENFVGGPQAWAKTIDLRSPVEVKIRGGRLELWDGYHRYLAAKLRGVKLPCQIAQISDNPVKWIMDGKSKLIVPTDERRSS